MLTSHALSHISVRVCVCVCVCGWMDGWVCVCGQTDRERDGPNSLEDRQAEWQTDKMYDFLPATSQHNTHRPANSDCCLINSSD